MIDEAAIVSVEEAAQASNEAYLAAAMRWLHALLAEEPAPGDVAAARERLREAESATPRPRLIDLAGRFALSPFERDILLLCVAMEIDTRIPYMCAQAQGDPAAAYPTFALALRLFEGGSWSALSLAGALRYWRLIEVVQGHGRPFLTAPLHAEESIVNAAKGIGLMDERLSALLTPVPSGWGLAPSQRETVRAAASALAASAPGSLPPVQMLGPAVETKASIALAACDVFGLRLHRLNAADLPAAAGEIDAFARLWRRECRLAPLALLIEIEETTSEGSGEPKHASVLRFLDRIDGVAFIAARESLAGIPPDTLTIDVSRPTPLEQMEAWAGALADYDGPADLAARLAGQFSVSLDAIRRLSAAALARAEGNPDAVWQACVSQVRPQLAQLAQPIDAKATWDDIVLPDEEKGLLRQIADQVRHRITVYEEWGFGEKLNRGSGIAALFAGESGTGKTMAAEVIANDLRLGLYRVDLSAIVSKYIGETEKNLRRVFDTAEGGGAILFFDEADALFGKRSEVKDSHDRYANIEINYLLQRMEAYRGLAILATNMKSAMDPAFMRRLRFIVHFPYPGVVERRQIWQKAWPPRVPVDAIDYDRLARLNLSGANIQSIAVNAAFAAARSASAVTMPLVLEAARAELKKLERPLSEANFR